MIRVLVTGGRDYDIQKVVDDALDAVLAKNPEGIVLIHGGASGADACAHAWAYAMRCKGHEVVVRRYQANWRTEGRKAGPLRNQRMIDEGRPDMAIAFPGGAGTADCVARCERAGISVTKVPS